MEDRNIATNTKNIQLRIRDPGHVTDSELSRRTLILIREHIFRKASETRMDANIFPLDIYTTERHLHHIASITKKIRLRNFVNHRMAC